MVHYIIRVFQLFYMHDTIFWHRYERNSQKKSVLKILNYVLCVIFYYIYNNDENNNCIFVFTSC